MLRRNIEHFLKKRRYEKLVFSFPRVFDFSKNMNSRLCILFLVDKSMTYLKNEHRVMRSKLEKQSFTDIPQNRCPWKFHKFHRKIPVLESLFNQVAGLKICNFIKKRLQHRYHEKETTEAVVRRYSSKWVFLKISQISQENTCVGGCF